MHACRVELCNLFLPLRPSLSPSLPPCLSHIADKANVRLWKPFRFKGINCKLCGTIPLQHCEFLHVPCNGSYICQTSYLNDHGRQNALFKYTCRTSIKHGYAHKNMSIHDLLACDHHWMVPLLCSISTP